MNYYISRIIIKKLNTTMMCKKNNIDVKGSLKFPYFGHVMSVFKVEVLPSFWMVGSF
jgi:hypothetical protein